jgi:carbonic anhydrase/acetyltransferase-like protein (isoleucine patch superfamily)
MAGPDASDPAMPKPPAAYGGGLLMPYDGIVPTLGRDAYVAPNAVVIGDVVLGDRASIWFNCLVRGDGNYIRIGAETNLQDGTIIHISTNNGPTIIGERVTVGHGAIIHACTIEDDTMIGIGAIVLDKAVIERGAVVAAGAVVPPGKVVKAGEMWSGVPAQFTRKTKDSEIKFIARNAAHYVELAGTYLHPERQKRR